MEKCHNCSDRLTDTGRGRPQKFCSDRCRKVHGRLNGQKVASTGKGLGGPIAHEDQLEGSTTPPAAFLPPAKGRIISREDFRWRGLALHCGSRRHASKFGAELGFACCRA